MWNRKGNETPFLLLLKPQYKSIAAQHINYARCDIYYLTYIWMIYHNNTYFVLYTFEAGEHVMKHQTLELDFEIKFCLICNRNFFHEVWTLTLESSWTIGFSNDGF